MERFRFFIVRLEYEFGKERIWHFLKSQDAEDKFSSLKKEWFLGKPTCETANYCRERCIVLQKYDAPMY